MTENDIILLVHPEISRTKYNFAGIIDNEPLELEYIWAMLAREGYRPYIWDGQVEKIPFRERLHELRPAAVYICGRTRQEGFMKEYALEAKKAGAVAMIGGLHAQRCYNRFFRSAADYIFTGFDPSAVTDVLGGKSPETISSLCWKKDGHWVVNKAVPHDIRTLIRPDRSYFYQHADRYRYLELLPAAHVRTAYSCPYRCSFCIRNRLNCGVYSQRDIEDVVDEIAQIECENIYIIDDDFLFGEERLEQFVTLIRQRGIHKRYVCYGRADFIAAHPKLMGRLAEIGLYYVLVGIESADDSHLRSYGKLSDNSVNVKAVKLLGSLGVNTMGMFIVDLDFTAADFRNIWKWVVKNDLRHAAVSIFTPEMNTELIKKYRSRLITRDPSHWDYLHVVAKPAKLSVRRYYFHYHVLLIRLFLRAWRQGIYDFIDYRFFIGSMIKNMFGFGG
ncbi:MAG: radical SAM protein [Ruminococcus sp.]|nr:radical SAM protein [Ruminococcus sp.]